MLQENLSPPSSEPVPPGLFPQLPVSEDGMDDDSEGGCQTTKVEANRVRTWRVANCDQCGCVFAEPFLE